MMYVSEKFNGFNAPIEEFFKQYESIATYNGWNEPTKLIAMQIYLTGPAFFYFQTKKTSTTTYDEMKNLFEAEFGEPSHQPTQTEPLPNQNAAEQPKQDQTPSEDASRHIEIQEESDTVVNTEVNHMEKSSHTQEVEATAQDKRPRKEEKRMPADPEKPKIPSGKPNDPTFANNHAKRDKMEIMDTQKRNLKGKTSLSVAKTKQLTVNTKRKNGSKNKKRVKHLSIPIKYTKHAKKPPRTCESKDRRPKRTKMRQEKRKFPKKELDTYSSKQWTERRDVE